MERLNAMPPGEYDKYLTRDIDRPTACLLDHIIKESRLQEGASTYCHFEDMASIRQKTGLTLHKQKQGRLTLIRLGILKETEKPQGKGLWFKLDMFALAKLMANKR